MDKINFINKLKDTSIKGWQEYKILPSLTIAQAILESGWGKSNKIPNNLFGIKADNSWKGKKQLAKTTEFINGRKVEINAYFRVYDNINDSLKDRYSFLTKPRYSKIINETDYKTACKEIWKAGYATDPLYPEKLINIIEQNKLYEIDKIAINNTSYLALDGWNWAIKNNLLDGTRPKDKITREEISIVFNRIFKGG